MNRLLTICAGLALPLALMNCHGESGESGDLGATKEVALEAKRVSVAPIVTRDFEREFRATGAAMPTRQAVIRSLADGPIAEMRVDIGDAITEGQTLFVVRPVDAELAVRTAEAGLATAQAALADLKAWRRPEEVQGLAAQLARAQAEYRRLDEERKRMETLFERKSISASEWDMARTAAEAAAAQVALARENLAIAQAGPTEEQIRVAEANVAQAEARLAQARQSLEDTAGKAPFAGKITQRHVKRGDFARRGDPVVELTDLSVLEAELQVPERFAGLVAPGFSVEVYVEAVGLRRTATITAVSGGVEPRTRTYLVKAELDNADETVKSGMFCTAEFKTAPVTGATAVPLEAVHQDEGKSFVWVVLDGKAHQVFVELGERDAQYRQVLGDFPPNVPAVVAGAGALAEGTLVEIVNGENSRP